MSRRRVSNPLALAVLGCLRERPMHPYEISTTLRSRGKESSIKLNYGSLYSVVESLQKHGLITTRETTREGRRPERTVYQITEAGVTEFEGWLAELISVPVRDYTSLEAGLSLMVSLPPDEICQLLDQRAVRLRIELRGLEGAAQVGDEIGLPEVFSVEARFRHAMLTAELAFVAELAQRVRDGSVGGTALWRRLHELRADGMDFEQILADPVRHLGEEAQILQSNNEPPRKGAGR